MKEGWQIREGGREEEGRKRWVLFQGSYFIKGILGIKKIVFYYLKMI